MTEHRMAPPAEPITAQLRSTVVDIVKGIAITLVVYGHTAQGMFHRGWWTGPTSSFSDWFVYSFHMPVFFFVAGLFLTSSLQRRGPVNFIVDKVKTIFYPYIVWLMISASIEPLIGRFKMASAPFDWKHFAVTLLDGDASWFLPTLFCCQLLALATWKIPGWLRLSIAVAAAALMKAYGPAILYRTVQEFCFLAAGMMVGRLVFRLKEIPSWGAASGAILLFAFQTGVILRDGANAQFGSRHQWMAIVLGFTGTAGLLLLARLLDNTRFGDAWAWVGKASLGVFLLSPFAQGAMRELLLRLGHTHELWLQLLLPTAVATILPAIVWHQQERWRIGWLFHWPSH